MYENQTDELNTNIHHLKKIKIELVVLIGQTNK